MASRRDKKELWVNLLIHSACAGNDPATVYQLKASVGKNIHLESKPFAVRKAALNASCSFCLPADRARNTLEINLIAFRTSKKPRIGRLRLPLALGADVRRESFEVKKLKGASVCLSLAIDEQLLPVQTISSPWALTGQNYVKFPFPSEQDSNSHLLHDVDVEVSEHSLGVTSERFLGPPASMSLISPNAGSKQGQAALGKARCSRAGCSCSVF